MCKQRAGACLVLLAVSYTHLDVYKRQIIRAAARTVHLIIFHKQILSLFRKVFPFIPVSYTHLDVYKRQVQQVSYYYSIVFFIGKSIRIIFAVSYTHLDVYKRQVRRWSVE